jgi:hypothetical protein
MSSQIAKGMQIRDEVMIAALLSIVAANHQCARQDPDQGAGAKSKGGIDNGTDLWTAMQQ